MNRHEDDDAYVQRELERDMKAFAREEGFNTDFEAEGHGEVVIFRPRRRGRFSRWLRLALWRVRVWWHMGDCQSCGEGRPGRCSFWDEAPPEEVEKR